MAVKKIELEGIGSVAVYKRRGLKSMRLSVTNTGTIRLTIPTYVPFAAAVAFAQSKREWLLQHAAAVRSTLQNAQPIGKNHTLRFVVNFQIQSPQTRVKNNEILVNYPSSVSIDDVAVQDAATKACVRALRDEAESLLPERVATVAARTEFRYKSVVIKKLRGRWGSCDQDNNIVLNLFLMQLPWELIDYVILHELVHTKHLNHGDNFWDEFMRWQPAAKSLRKQIRAHQPNFAAAA
jgi:predicted metal-dependent hydrolase